jgi:hypothetical protein
MAKYQKHIFNLTKIEDKTGIRKLKLNEFLTGKVYLSDPEKRAVQKLIMLEAKQFLQLFEDQNEETPSN